MGAAGFLLASCKKDKFAEETGDLNAGTSSTLAIITLPEVISVNTTLDAANTYILDGKVWVKNGATLTIPAGTRLEGLYKADAAQASALIVTKTGKITAKGTQANPIIFTSSLTGLPGGRTNRLPGDWGGVVILGDAPTNRPDGNNQIEGVVTFPTGGSIEDTYYGGPAAGTGNSAHNGGLMNYCRIEFAGAVVAPNRELNSLTLGGCGTQTALRYIQASYGADDAFEFFGGLVNPKYLIANAQNDDGFDFDFGYRGNFQFGISVRNPAYTVADANGIECDNDATGTTATPTTRPEMSNLTIVGRCSGVLTGTLNGAKFRRGTDLRMRNSIIMGYANGVSFENTLVPTTAAFFRNNGVHAFTATDIYVGTSVAPWGLANVGVVSASTPTNWINNACPAAHATYKSSALAFKVGGAFDPATPGSLLPNFAGMTSNFLNTVPYIGAVGNGSPIKVGNNITIPNNWVAGSAGVWINFDPS